jgi:hypothetical protein
MGIRDKPIAPASPSQNSFAERLIGSIRRECLDHIIVLGEEHLRWILKNYTDYYGYPDYRVDLRPAPHFGTPVIVIGPDKTVIIVGGGTR